MWGREQWSPSCDHTSALLLTSSTLSEYPPVIIKPQILFICFNQNIFFSSTFLGIWTYSETKKNENFSATLLQHYLQGNKRSEVGNFLQSWEWEVTIENKCFRILCFMRCSWMNSLHIFIFNVFIQSFSFFNSFKHEKTLFLNKF